MPRNATSPGNPPPRLSPPENNYNRGRRSCCHDRLSKMTLSGKGLDTFHASFYSVYEDRSISCSPDALGQLGREGRIDKPLLERRAAFERVSSPEKALRTPCSLDQTQKTLADVPKKFFKIMSKLLITGLVSMRQPNPSIGVVMAIDWFNTHSYNLPR